MEGTFKKSSPDVVVQIQGDVAIEEEANANSKESSSANLSKKSSTSKISDKYSEVDGQKRSTSQRVEDSSAYEDHREKQEEEESESK